MYMNIQGAELMALQGATKALDHLKGILLEINFNERYNDSPSADALDEYLAGFGFEPQWGQINTRPGTGNGFALYTKV